MLALWSFSPETALRERMLEPLRALGEWERLLTVLGGSGEICTCFFLFFREDTSTAMLCERGMIGFSADSNLEPLTSTEDDGDVDIMTSRNRSRGDSFWDRGARRRPPCDIESSDGSIKNSKQDICWKGQKKKEEERTENEKPIFFSSKVACFCFFFWFSLSFR